MKNVRIYFKKTSRMKFVSHLDMTRVMSRLIKKSGIPIWYTEGFNKHIYMNFALPLSLGFEGFGEIMDIRLVDEEYECEDVLTNLQKVCPDGIEITAVCEPVKATKEIGFAEYTLEFDEIDAHFNKNLTEFFALESVLCQKKGKKGKIKEIDIMPKIRKSEIIDNKINLTLAAGSEDNLNPSLIMDAFFEKYSIAPIFYSVSRYTILDKQGNKFL